MADDVPPHRIVPVSAPQRVVDPYNRVLYTQPARIASPNARSPTSPTTEETRALFFPSLILIVITFGGLYLIRRNYLREEWTRNMKHDPIGSEGITSMSEQAAHPPSSTPLEG